MIEGRHVKFLGHGCDPAKLGNVEHVKATITALVEACGMRALGLHAYDVDIEIAKLRAEPFEDEGGITVVGVLSTSHAAIHTWPARGFFVLDVYSCRDFDPDAVRRLLFAAFARSDKAQPIYALPVAIVEVRRTEFAPEADRRCSPNAVVSYSTGGMTLRQAELSFALDMPKEWREPAPEFRA